MCSMYRPINVAIQELLNGGRVVEGEDCSGGQYQHARDRHSVKGKLIPTPSDTDTELFRLQYLLNSCV